MWVRFTRDFDWSPPETGGRVTMAYKAGMKLMVRRQCADEAIAKRAAIVEERNGGGKTLEPT